MKKILFGVKVAGSVALFLRCVFLEIRPGPARLPETIPGQISKIDSHAIADQAAFPHINQLKQNK